MDNNRIIGFIISGILILGFIAMGAVLSLVLSLFIPGGFVVSATIIVIICWILFLPDILSRQKEYEGGEQKKLKEEQERLRQEEEKRLKEEQEKIRQEEERRLKEEQERLRQEEEKRLKEEQERLRKEEEKRLKEEREKLERNLKLDFEKNGHIYFVLWIHKIRIIKKLQNILEENDVIITDKSIYNTFLEVYRLSVETRNLCEFKEALLNEGSRIIREQLERNLGENCFTYNEGNLYYEYISSWGETEATLISKIINTISHMISIIILYREKQNILDNEEFYCLIKKFQIETFHEVEYSYLISSYDRAGDQLYDLYTNFYSDMLTDNYNRETFITLIDIVICSESIVNDSQIRVLLENKLEFINCEEIITQITEDINKFDDDYLKVFGQIYQLINNDYYSVYDDSIIIKILYMLEVSRRISKLNTDEIFGALLKVRQISNEIEVALRRKKLEEEKQNYLTSKLEDDEIEDEDWGINESNGLEFSEQEQYMKIEQALKEELEKNGVLCLILWINNIYDINQIRGYLENQEKNFVSDESLYNMFLDVYKLSRETLNLSDFIETVSDVAGEIIYNKLGEKLYSPYLKQIFDKIIQMVGIIILYREKENIINNEEFYNLMQNMQSSLGLHNSREKLYDMYINFYSNLLNDNYSEQNFSVLSNIIFCSKAFEEDLKIQRLLENKLQSFKYDDIVKMISEEIEDNKVYLDSVLKDMEIDGRIQKIEETLYMIHLSSVHSITLKEIFDLLLKVSNISSDVEIYLKRKKLEADRQRYLMNDFTKEKEMELELLNLSNVSNGIEFEKYLETLFKKLGYVVQTTKVSGDQGADLIVIKDKTKTVVQAKFYSSKVGNKAVQEVAAAIRYYNADFGMVITNNYYTDSAIKLADANDIKLIDGDTLSQLISELGSNI